MNVGKSFWRDVFSVLLMMEYNQLLDQLLTLLSSYFRVKRKSTQPYHRELLKLSGSRYDPDDLLTRESLIEHVWSLPVIATTIFPYIQDSGIDIWKVLTMLAVHDIGELEVGDEICFKKQDNKKEKTAALWLLHPMYHDLYLDIELQKSSHWKFAKSIDKLAPEFLDIMCEPHDTIERYKQHMSIEKNEIVPLKLSHKRSYMEWNPYLLWFFDFICDYLDKRLLDT